MANPVTILIACGSGIATSTVAQEKIKAILSEEGIPARIVKGTVSQIPSLADDVDVIMVTTRYQGEVTKPVVQVFGLLSGIQEDKVKQQVIDTCRQALSA